MEEPQLSRLSNLNRDLLSDIASRLDGSALSSMACTCSTLQLVAQDQRLWKKLYYSTWPSTSLPEAQQLISSSDFRKLYADSFPLLLHQTPTNENKNIKPDSKLYPSDYASLVDVYYKNLCVFSKVLDGITTYVDVFQENHSESRSANWTWFLNSPFKLYLLNNKEDDIENPGWTSPIEYTGSQYDCTRFMENTRLSWVLLDKKKGRAVNVSSWRPALVKRCWPYQSDYMIQFESAIPVEKDLAKCLIEVRCRLMKTEAYPELKEISMRIETMMGAHVNGAKSLTILDQAFYSPRSANRQNIKLGRDKFERVKNELLRRRTSKEKLADWLCLLTEVAVFIILCCSFMKSLL
ncbi:hypothetical protein ACFE04_004728 [Oxalis oulophora]